MDFVTQAQEIATSGIGDLWGIFGNSLAFVILAGVLFLFALRAGRAAFLSLVIALYAGYGLYIVFPYLDEVLALSGSPLIKFGISVGLYLVAVLIPYLLLRRVAVSDFVSIGFVGLLLLSVITAGFLFALAYFVFDVGSVYSFSASIESLFAPAKYFFWWFIAPLVGLLFLAR